MGSFCSFTIGCCPDWATLQRYAQLNLRFIEELFNSNNKKNPEFNGLAFYILVLAVVNTSLGSYCVVASCNARSFARLKDVMVRKCI